MGIRSLAFVSLMVVAQEAGQRTPAAPALRTPEATRAYATITDKDVKKTMDLLAGPEMEGRRAGSRGAKRAAEFIAKSFEEAGLTGLGKEGSFFVPFQTNAIVAKDEECRMAVTRGTEKADLKLGEDFLPVIGSGGGEASGEPVFVGYGIKAPEFGYDDFAGAQVKGKIAVCIWHEPRHGEDGKAFDGKEITRHSSMRSKAKAAAEAGAVALLIAPDPLNTKDEGPLGQQLPWAVGIEGLRAALGDYRPTIPIATVSVAVAEKVLVKKLKDLQSAIDKAVVAKPLPPVKGVLVTVAAATKTERIEMFNVAGILRGTDPELAKEAVVIGCHYDHEGTDDSGAVFAGADDNASGTTALVTVARGFGAGKVATRRSLVFAAFSAEERGLVGSEAFAKDCPVPLADVVAMLQMDMVGRAREGRLHLLGTGYSKDLAEALKKAATLRPVNLKLDWDESDNLTRQFWERSDQYSFAKRDVPAVFFFTGEHPDYHKPLDTPEKIEIKALAEVAKLAFNFAHVLANQDARPGPSKYPGKRR
jgi:hypothetical protein